MGSLGLLFLPTLGGYWFLRKFHFMRYSLLRESGYHVLFKSAVVGLFLVLIARVLIVFLFNPFIPYLGEFWKSFAPSNYSGTASLSALLGFALPYVSNWFYTKEKAIRRAEKESGHLTELLIREINERGELAEISLKNRKTYIGFILESGMTGHEESDIAVLPVNSGYRKEDTLELKITTDYLPLVLDFLETQLVEEELREEDFRVVIPISEIVSVRIFDPDLYELFQTKSQN